MKNTGLLIAFLLGCFIANSQPVITNSTFPKAGDKLKYATIVSPDFELDLKSPAGPRAWDFSMLNRGVKYEESYVVLNAGSNPDVFPDADLVLVSGREETYIKSSGTKLEALGLGGINPIFNAPLAIRYTTNPYLRQAPLEFVGSTRSESKFRIALNANVFPDSLLASIPANFKPDSIRVEFSSQDKSIMDAYGTLSMQDETFDVLREKVEVETTTSVFMKVPVLGWLNLETVSGLISLPPFITQFLGKRESIVYRFHSNDKKEILVSATYSTDNELRQVDFADLGKVTATENVQIQSMNCYPNPVNHILNIPVDAIPAGMYLVTLTDYSGKVVYAAFDMIQNGETKRMDVSRYATGAYFLTLRSQDNQVVATSKVLIAK